MRAEFGQRGKTRADVCSHGPLGSDRAAGNDGRGDQLVVCVGLSDALPRVKSREQQLVNRHGQLRKKLRDVSVASAFEDQFVPIVVKQSKLIMQAAGSGGVELLLQGYQSLLEIFVARRGKGCRSKALKRHAGLVNLPDLVLTQLPHRSATELFDGDQAFGFKSPQRFTYLAAADPAVADQVGFNQPLSGYKPAFAYAFADPGCGVDWRCDFAGLAHV